VTPRVRFVELRGNVDTRLRRLREPRGSARQLDGVVLAFAGIGRLWADESAHEAAAALLSDLPRMVLPLSACPAAPAQGALAIECRLEDEATARLLASLDDAATRRSIDAERALLAERGGGCQQRFGATQIELKGLGGLLYIRAAEERGEEVELGAVEVRWTPATPLPVPSPPVRAWDGTRAARPGLVPLAGATGAAAHALESARAVFIAHRRALPEGAQLRAGTPLWVPGLETWRALAERGIWVEGCAEGLGFAHIESLLSARWLRLPEASEWTILTHAQAAREWSTGRVIPTYESAPAGEGPPADATHVYWASGAQFERWRARLGDGTVHSCGPGKTYDHLVRGAVPHVRLFPQVQQWRQWLQL
jgi:hydroxymethylbilane synthase